MTLHDTISESTLSRSIRKFFVDNFEVDSSGSAVECHFERIYMPEESHVDQWMCIRLRNLFIRSVSSVDLIIHLFTKNDLESVLLAGLRDTVFDCLQENIDLYDASWNVVGSMKIYPNSESEVVYLPDNARMKVLTLTLKWGAVY